MLFKFMLLLIFMFRVSSLIAYPLGQNYLYMLSHTEKNNSNRFDDFPFLSGDTFRHFADHIYDETLVDFVPESVKGGDVIFVNTYILYEFFNNYHKKIKEPYILITHNSDFFSPGDFIGYLNDSLLLHWFGCNPDTSHPKFTPIPLGICNKWARKYSVHDFFRYQNQKEFLCYFSVSLNTNYNVRANICNLLRDKPFIYKSQWYSSDKYLEVLAKSKYAISPPGRGLDCYRVWESLYLETIPIVVSSGPINELYLDLPILIIDDWRSLTEAYLANKYVEIRKKSTSGAYNYAKTTFAYWWDQIEFKRNQFLCS